MEKLLACDISSKENCFGPIETDKFWVKESEFTAVIAKELADLHVHIKLFNKEITNLPKKVTKISIVYEVLNKKPTNKKCLPEIHDLLQIYCGIAFRLLQKGVLGGILTWLKNRGRQL